ncbi:MAG: acyl-CoA synthetase (AMP-forming)/AMP-acid ligase II [Oleispira sp.]|jgi:acyl-CoA synthetase (AMP-forming)/AMP-acid ligase II
MKARLVNFTNVVSHALFQPKGILPLAKGLYTLISSKPDKYRSIGSHLEKHARKRPDSPAIRYQQDEFSYSQVNAWVNRYAHYFISQGIQPGDAIGINIENRTECLIAVLAVVKTGAIAAMINTSQRGEVLLHSINLVKPKMMLIGEEQVEAMASVIESLDIKLRTQLHYLKDNGLEEKTADTRPCPNFYQDMAIVSKDQSEENPDTTGKIQMKQPCFYIFTSGTTGLPKASVMSHYRWHKSMAGMGLASMRLTHNDVMYLSLPLYHNNALTVSMAGILGAGGCLAIGRKFSVSGFWDEIRQHKATTFCYIGELCRYLLNSPAQANDQDHTIRAAIGNGLRPDIWMEFKQRFGINHINEFYGASECNLVFTNALNLDCTAGVCPLPYNVVEYDIEVDAPIRNEQGFMIPVKKGDTGLLITEINAKQPFDGYTDKEASEKKILKDVFTREDRWFNTGDMVINQGFKHIAFADRLGDTFRWKGENVATTEVEAVANEYPGVEHSVAYGVEIPGTDGRAGMAALTLKDINDFDTGAFSRHLHEKLPAYAVPIFIRIREQEEITGTFKYRKVELKKEHYDLNQVSEPLFMMSAEEQQFVPLDSQILLNIQQQNLRF